MPPQQCDTHDVTQKITTSSLCCLRWFYKLLNHGVYLLLNTLLFHDIFIWSINNGTVEGVVLLVGHEKRSTAYLTYHTQMAKVEKKNPVTSVCVKPVWIVTLASLKQKGILKTWPLVHILKMQLSLTQNKCSFSTEFAIWSHYNEFIHKDFEGVEHDLRSTTSNTLLINDVLPEGLQRFTVSLVLLNSSWTIIPRSIAANFIPVQRAAQTNIPPLPFLVTKPIYLFWSSMTKG